MRNALHLTVRLILLCSAGLAYAAALAPTSTHALTSVAPVLDLNRYLGQPPQAYAAVLGRSRGKEKTKEGTFYTYVKGGLKFKISSQDLQVETVNGSVAELSELLQKLGLTGGYKELVKTASFSSAKEQGDAFKIVELAGPPAMRRVDLYQGTVNATGQPYLSLDISYTPATATHAKARVGQPVSDGKTVPASVQQEIRAAYQQLADAYEQKKPDVVLEHFTEDFRSTTVGNGEPASSDRDAFERKVRAYFPGNDHGPSLSYDLRAFKPAGPNAVTVVLWSYGAYPINGKDPASGNASGEYSAVHRWVNQGGWKLREELLKAGVKTPAPSKQMISGRP